MIEGIWNISVRASEDQWDLSIGVLIYIVTLNVDIFGRIKVSNNVNRCHNHLVIFKNVSKLWCHDLVKVVPGYLQSDFHGSTVWPRYLLYNLLGKILKHILSVWKMNNQLNFFFPQAESFGNSFCLENYVSEEILKNVTQSVSNWKH